MNTLEQSLLTMPDDRAAVPQLVDFNWRRFWCPRGGVLQLDWKDFLLAPDEASSAYLETDVVPAEEFDSVPCVVLLGEPGMGKSYEIKRLVGRAVAPHSFIARDLRQYDSTEAIRADIFQSDVFRDWAEGEGDLTLVLDSLDEALLEIRPLVVWLVEELRKWGPDRLQLRIACRTAQWPQVVESGLRSIWGDGGLEVFEIAPLSRSDVHLAAQVRGVDPDAFLDEVFRRNAAPLASKPTTLNFLLSAFVRDEAFPATQVELFRLGCQHLCEEDEARRISGRAGSLNPRQRLAISGRIAAASVFGNRFAVWRGQDLAVKSATEVALADLVGGFEPVEGGESMPVTERELEETLGTGLFSARGAVSLGWAHQTYAEFLAARWVIEHEFSPQQIEDLIKHPDDPDHSFVPQLRETIVWLTAMSTETRSIVLATEPELLLDCDPAALGHEERFALVEALLTVAERGELGRPEWGRR